MNTMKINRQIAGLFWQPLGAMSTFYTNLADGPSRPLMLGLSGRPASNSVDGLILISISCCSIRHLIPRTVDSYRRQPRLQLTRRQSGGRCARCSSDGRKCALYRPIARSISSR